MVDDLCQTGANCWRSECGMNDDGWHPRVCGFFLYIFHRVQYSMVL
jgi:hypothetical protein